MYKEYLTVSNIVGPLVIVEKIRDVKYGELVEIETGEGLLRRGTVLDISKERAVVQVFDASLTVPANPRTEDLRLSPIKCWIYPENP
jgi:V/A-type H+-transporting ATPase subunit B